MWPRHLLSLLFAAPRQTVPTEELTVRVNPGVELWNATTRSSWFAKK